MFFCDQRYTVVKHADDADRRLDAITVYNPSDLYLYNLLILDALCDEMTCERESALCEPAFW